LSEAGGCTQCHTMSLGDTAVQFPRIRAVVIFRR